MRTERSLPGWAACWLALTLLAGGCAQREVLGKVSGKVTFEGKPVAKAMVLFQNKERAVYMMAPIDEKGQFEVSMAAGYGLPPGDYQVSISPPPLDAPPGPIMERPDYEDKFPNISARYRNPETSGITITVVKGENPLVIELRP